MYFARCSATLRRVASSTSDATPFEARAWFVRVIMWSSSVDEKARLFQANTRPGFAARTTKATTVASEASQLRRRGARALPVDRFGDMRCRGYDGRIDHTGSLLR